MKLRVALSALTAVAIVATAPALALAQPTMGDKSVPSTSVPKPSEKSVTTTHAMKHHIKAKKTHHRNHAGIAKTSAKRPGGATATMKPAHKA
jgi:hypothetical protein